MHQLNININIICTITIQTSQHYTLQKHNLFKLLFFLQLQEKKKIVMQNLITCHIYFILNYKIIAGLSVSKTTNLCFFPTNHV